MTEKYSLLPINPQQLTPAQKALKRMSDKHLDFEIQAVNTIRPPDIDIGLRVQGLMFHCSNIYITKNTCLCYKCKVFIMKSSVYINEVIIVFGSVSVVLH